MKKLANITDVARLAGVSRSTVSRVLTNSGNVKKGTALKVRKAIRDADYRPNILARGLATGKLNIIALLMSETDNPFYMQMIDQFDTELRNRGFILSLCYLGRTEEARRRNFRTIQEYGFAGFIIGDIKDEPLFVAEVRTVRRPLVFFNRYIETLSSFDVVVVDNYLGGYQAGKHLTYLGHRRIGVLTGPLQSSASRDRFRGFRDALAESGVEIPPEAVGTGDLTLASGIAFAEKFFPENRNRCTALFAGNDIMAIGILTYCRSNNIRVPEELSLIGFDDLSFAGSSLINLTTIRQPYIQMSELTAERIVSRINGEKLPRQRIMLEPHLVRRATTAPVSG